MGSTYTRIVICNNRNGQARQTRQNSWERGLLRGSQDFTKGGLQGFF